MQETELKEETTQMSTKGSKNHSQNQPISPLQSATKTKELKSKEERVKEGINILTKLKETGVAQDESFNELKKVISNWVNTGEYWTGSVPFPQYGKVVTGHLPRYRGQQPMMVFKLI